MLLNFRLCFGYLTIVICSLEMMFIFKENCIFWDTTKRCSFNQSVWVRNTYKEVKEAFFWRFEKVAKVVLRTKFFLKEWKKSMFFQLKKGKNQSFLSSKEKKINFFSIKMRILFFEESLIIDFSLFVVKRKLNSSFFMEENVEFHFIT